MSAVKFMTLFEAEIRPAEYDVNLTNVVKITKFIGKPIHRLNQQEAKQKMVLYTHLLTSRKNTKPGLMAEIVLGVHHVFCYNKVYQ